MASRHKLFLFFAILLLATKIYGLWMEDGIRFIRVIGWWDFGFLALGWILSNYQQKAGLPPILGKELLLKNWWRPFLAGMLFAALDVLVIEGLLRNEAHTSLPPYTQPFPYSIFLYSSATVYMELVYKLIPFTIGLLLLGLMGLRKKTWIYGLMVLLACWEPLEQMPSSPAWFVAYSLGSGFLFNFMQLYFYHRFGWIYSFFARLGLYLVWHVALGVWIEYFVLR
jgi:hypothetical protein